MREIPGRAEALECLFALFSRPSPGPAYALIVLIDEATWSLETGDSAAADRLLQAAYQVLLRHVPDDTRAFRWSATSLLLVQARSPATPAPPTPPERRAKLFNLDDFCSCNHLVRALDLWVGRNLFEPRPQF